MTDADLIAACKQIASLTESIDRHARALAEKGENQSVQGWHDNRMTVRAAVIAMIRKQIARDFQRTT